MTPYVRLRNAQITGRQLAAQIPAPAATHVWRRRRGLELEHVEGNVLEVDRVQATSLDVAQSTGNQIERGTQSVSSADAALPMSPMAGRNTLYMR